MKKHTCLINNKHFLFSKKMGQNFLVDLNVAQQIVKLVKPNNYDLVIEVGPGNGALTQYLVKTSNKMIAIELDKRLTESLRKQFNQYKNLEIINDDILNVSLSNIAQNYQNVLLISNLPYSISTPMLLHFLNQNTINVFYCMLQKELVDRLIAKPSHKTYGAISVLMQYYATINKIMNVDAQTFFPSPKISSNFILIKKHDDSKRFDVKWSKFIQQSFRFKRKMLLNNLKSNFDTLLLLKTFKKFNINPNVRAEQLSATQLFQLYECLSKNDATH